MVAFGVNGKVKVKEGEEQSNGWTAFMYFGEKKKKKKNNNNNNNNNSVADSADDFE